MMNRYFIFVAALLFDVMAYAGSIDLTVDEFKMFQQYRNALADPRVQKMKPDLRLAAIAKDAGFKLKDLQKAIEKGEAAGDIKTSCEHSVRAELEKTELSGRLGKVDVDVDSPHAVAYVMWLNEDVSKLDAEASLVAAMTIAGCPIVSTIQVWSQSTPNPQSRVFQALVSGSAAKNIKIDRVKDFATTRYLRLFEKVKSINNGDDFSTEINAGRSSASGN